MKKRSAKYAFIDSQNLNLGIQSQGWKLDFEKFRIYLNDKFKIDKAFLFIGYIPKYEKLYQVLKKANYILVFKPTIESKQGEIKGNVDAELVLHTMIELENFDKAMIVSGDGDFHCLVQFLKKKNKLGRIIIPNRKKYSSLYSKYKKYVFFLNDLKHKLARG